MTRNMKRTCHGLVVLLSFSLCCSGSPEDGLAGHIEEITKVLEDNTDNPVDAVEEIRAYAHSNLPDIMELLGEALVAMDSCDRSSCRRELLESWEEALEEPAEGLMEVMAEIEEVLQEDRELRRDLEDWFEDLEEEHELVEEVFEDALRAARPQTVCDRAVEHFLDCIIQFCRDPTENPICEEEALSELIEEARGAAGIECDDRNEEEAQEMLDTSCEELTAIFALAGAFAPEEEGD